MDERVASASLEELRLRAFRLHVASPTKVRIYRDANGGYWRRTYLPLDANVVDDLRLQQDAGQIELLEEPMPEEDFRAEEMAWLQENQSRVAALYPGEWIAVDGLQLVAHAADLATLLRLSREAGHPDPFVTAIPAEPIVSLHV